MSPVLSDSSHFLIVSASGESSNSVVTFVSLINSSSCLMLLPTRVIPSTFGLAIIVVTLVTYKSLVYQVVVASSLLVVQRIEVVLLSGIIIVVGGGVVSKPPFRT